MAEGNRHNYDKDRKSEAQKRFDAADNAGRFAGEDADAKSAQNEAVENIRQDASAGQGNNQNPSQSDNNRYSDAEARRDPAQSHDYKAEAQNVNDDTGRPLTDEEASKARNKATEGLKQGRQNTENSTNM